MNANSIFSLHRMIKSLLCIVLLLTNANAQLVNSETGVFWLRNDGDDSNSGTSSAEAWQTLNHASTEISGGDILIIDGNGGPIDMAGQQVSFTSAAGLDGTRNQWTRIIGVNDATITASNPNTTYVILKLDADYLELNNITFDGNRGEPTYGSRYMIVRPEDQTVIGQTKNIRIVNCTFKDNAGISNNEDNTKYVYRLFIEHCSFANVRFAISLETANFRSDLGSEVRIENCSFYGDNNSGGWVYRSESASNSGLTSFKNNIVSNFHTVFRTHGTSWQAAAVENAFNLYNTYTTFDDDGNITVNSTSKTGIDPLFVDPANDVLNIQASSPAIGFGALGQTIGFDKRSAIDASY